MEPILLTVTNRVSDIDRSQDEIYEFTENHQRRTFGRDDTACDIVIWPAVTGNHLARVAGEIWCWEDQLWLRNLSTTHEIAIDVPDLPPEPALRRRRDATARGDACSLPSPFCTVTAPGGCYLEVVQEHQPPPAAILYGVDEPTVNSVPEVPKQLRLIAIALCEPLLLGHRFPAAYGEVMQRTGEATQRIARRKVEELTDFYTKSVPELSARARQRQEDTDSAGKLVRDGMIYAFESDSANRFARSRGFVFPAYYDVARLLVRHYRITKNDLTDLPEQPHL